MNIPPDVNTRAEEMWRIISQKVDFRKKSVIDLGCGHGEMLWRAYVAGAKMVYGIECESSKIECYMENEWISNPDVFVTLEDINELVRIGQNIYGYDIAMCFSVLPYLNNIQETLRWMSIQFELCLLEIQYAPEPYNIGPGNDEQMFSLLRDAGFDIVMNLGSTYVKIRDVHRTIWACSAQKVRI